MFEDLRYELARQSVGPISLEDSPTVIYETCGAAELGINPSPTTIYDNCVAAQLRTMGLCMEVAQDAPSPAQARKQAGNSIVKSLGRKYRTQLHKRSVAFDAVTESRNIKGMETGAFIKQYFAAPDEDVRSAILRLATQVDVSSVNTPRHSFYNTLQAYASKLPLDAKIKDCDQKLLEDLLSQIID